MTEEDVFGPDIDLFVEFALERGFYPENLPPVFRIENFHEAAIPHLKSETFVLTKPTEPVTYNASKRGGSRRNFEMPNPAFMVDAAIFFTRFQQEIFEHFSTTDDSLSVPRFSDEGRPVRITSYSDFHRVRRQRLATSRYVVRTDISRYFHSVYTHSIPWALHGKAASKKDRKVESSEIFGNRLDAIFRQAKDGQTVGIPVGPDFSRFASEIIGKAIDLRFRKDVGSQHTLVRLVDDIFIGADDLDEANRLLTSMRDAVRHFQLDLNDTKTSIVATSLDLEPFWPVRIRREIDDFASVNPKKKGTTAGHDFVYFLDEVVRIANEEKDDGVVKYALRKMDDASVWDNYWPLVEPFLIRAAINFPHSWDYVARIVSWRHRTSGINAGLWSKVVAKVLSRQAPSGHDSEVCWALWLAKEAGLSLQPTILDAILDRCGAISALMAIDVYFSNHHDFAFPKEKLHDRIGERPMMGPDWLLAYEADRLFEFKLKTKNLIGLPFFEHLYDNDTEFYDRDAMPAQFEGIEDPNEVDSALEDIDSFYEDDFDDDDFDDDEDDDALF